MLAATCWLSAPATIPPKSTPVNNGTEPLMSSSDNPSAFAANTAATTAKPLPAVFTATTNPAFANAFVASLCALIIAPNSRRSLLVTIALNSPSFSLNSRNFFK